MTTHYYVAACIAGFLMVLFLIVRSGLYFAEKREAKKCESHEPLSDDEFHAKLSEGVKQLVLRGKSFGDIADKLFVSTPTLRRWLNKKNLPHPLMRAAVLETLNKAGK